MSCSALAEALLRIIICEKRNIEEADEEEDDYSSEEDDELANEKVRKSELPGSLRTVKGQGKNDTEDIDVTSPVEIFELFWDVDMFEYVEDQTDLYAVEKPNE
ncbi:hypothetical protein HHI36_000437 [Cryptolaemus montrouzieri]|uniref:Uncharacterized protein n=1 Tax=Cryptolaemus montrouzieri TaxID=559131 RepID=A0ABD2P4M6_9CUCU